MLPNEDIIETYQIVEENTSKDSKQIKSNIFYKVYFKNCISVLKDG